MRDGILGAENSDTIDETNPRVTVADLFFWIEGYEIPTNPSSIDLEAMTRNIKTEVNPENNRKILPTYMCDGGIRYYMSQIFNLKVRNTKLIRRSNNRQ